MNNFYEKTGLSNRLKESGILFLFIFISLIASLVIMNIIIFPIAFFSVKNKMLFTYAVKNLFGIIVIISGGFLLVKKIAFYKKNELTNIQIIKKIITKPIFFLLFLILILAIILILILIINFILQKNYYLIYKIINL